MKKRNYNIDFLRGVATLCIIIIHTAFWSGEAYLPPWFSNLTLLVDVPAFMYISGISFSYVKSFMKNIKGLLIQWKKWLYFLMFYTIILIVFFSSEFHIKDLISWIFYSFPNETSLIVVQGSIWFLPMYIKTTILCTSIICLNNYFAKKEKEQIDNLIKVIGIIIIVFSYCTLSNTKVIFDEYTLFYSFIYLLGYVSARYKINKKQMLMYEFINLILLVVTFIGFHYTISDFQTVKFPPSFPYIFVALPSIILFWYLKDNLKIKEDNKINYIGKNAIQFYFTQGISSSFLIKIYPYMPFTNKVNLFIIMLLMNVALVTLGAVFLEKSYEYITCKINAKKIKDVWFPRLKTKKEV